MQFYRKTRRGLGISIAKPLFKIFALIIVFMVIIFLINKIDLPRPYKTIKQEIPNEQFKVIK
jgi:predicted permease